MSASGSLSYFVQFNDGLQWCKDCRDCQRVLKEAYESGRSVTRVLGVICPGCLAGAQFPLDITGLTDTVIL